MKVTVVIWFPQVAEVQLDWVQFCSYIWDLCVQKAIWFCEAWASTVGWLKQPGASRPTTFSVFCFCFLKSTTSGIAKLSYLNEYVWLGSNSFWTVKRSLPNFSSFAEIQVKLMSDRFDMGVLESVCWVCSRLRSPDI